MKNLIIFNFLINPQNREAHYLLTILFRWNKVLERVYWNAETKVIEVNLKIVWCCQCSSWSTLSPEDEPRAFERFRHSAAKVESLAYGQLTVYKSFLLLTITWLIVSRVFHEICGFNALELLTRPVQIKNASCSVARQRFYSDSSFSYM